MLAAGPVSRIPQAALQARKLLEQSGDAVSKPSKLSTSAGFASHLRHNFCRQSLIQMIDNLQNEENEIGGVGSFPWAK